MTAKISRIKEDTEKLLKSRFDEDHRVIANYTPVCRKVASKINQNDSSFENKQLFKNNQREKRDRSQHNNSSIRYYKHSKKSRGSNHNNSSLNNINSNIRDRNNSHSTPNRNSNSNNSYSRSNSQNRSYTRN